MHRSGREVPFPGAVLLFQPSESSVMPSSVESADKARQGDKSDGIKGHFYFVLFQTAKQMSLPGLGPLPFGFTGLAFFGPGLPSHLQAVSPRCRHRNQAASSEQPEGLQ